MLIQSHIVILKLHCDTAPCDVLALDM